MKNFADIKPHAMDLSDQYWTENDIERLRMAKTLEEAGDIGVMILERMHASGKEIVQVCGPMTTGGLGTLSENMERFAIAIEQARAHGLLVFNQIPFQEAIERLTSHLDEEYCTDILDIFFRKILGCGYVSRALFLSDWESSRGARWEWDFVRSCGIPASPYPDTWLPSPYRANP